MTSKRVPKGRLPLLSVAALGVVFGDIGTSPLYTFKTILNMSTNATQINTIYGLLSLVVWTLILITSLKYVYFAMRFDNDGEGGILALMSLLGVKKNHRTTLIAIGLLGAALIYSDGAITPAISVLSALEGLNIVTPRFEPYIVPGAVAILFALFMVQSHGTAKIGSAFGPIMLLWFICIAIMGALGIAQHPQVLMALNPYYAINYLLSHGITGFFVLGGVFLCVTGSEALYADMGHFGKKPIWCAWYLIAFPSLLLNYAGQAAIVLKGGSNDVNIFYALCPPTLLIPYVILATLATITASQAVITGAFSMTRQAILLGCLPRMIIKQTSSSGYGQIYIGVVNFVLMVVTISLTIGFGKSSNLAAAYGIAVSLTMLMTSSLLFIAMREIWKWNLLMSSVVAGFFIIIDSAFFLSNLTKVAKGGFIPLIMGAITFGVMWIWLRGTTAVANQIETAVSIPKFMDAVKTQHIPRVPGTAIFLTRSSRDTPPVLLWHVKQNRALHQQIFVLRIQIMPVPRVEIKHRLTIKELANNIWRAEARYGFMEQPDIPQLLKDSTAYGCNADFSDIIYYVGHETIICRHDEAGLPAWQEELFAIMQRNAAHFSDFFDLPSNQVVEIGRHISI